MRDIFNMADNYITPLEMVILMSDEYSDEVIRKFKQGYCMGLDPNQYLTQICDDMGLVEGDLLPANIEKIENEVRKYLRSIYNV